MKRCPTCNVCFEDEASSCPQPHHAPLVHERAGALLLAGKYRLEYLLGKGGMGAVYAATQLKLNRPSAIKFLQTDYILEEARRANPAMGKDAQALERLRLHTLQRFEHEARAAAQLNHPNVVNIYEYDLLPEGEAYIGMELLRGQTLQEYVSASPGGRLSVEAAVSIIRQVAAGVRAAHSKGIIHRDLKPANIILVSDDEGFMQAKVVDFGLAKLREGNIPTRSLTEPGLVIGTVRYMSPEQCRGEELDARSDIYSLAVILFELLAGRPPFHSPNYMALALMHISERPPELSEYCPEAPPELVGLVRDSLQKDLTLRPQTVAEFLRRLPAPTRPLLFSPRALADGPAPRVCIDRKGATIDKVDEEEETAFGRRELGANVSEVGRSWIGNSDEVASLRLHDQTEADVTVAARRTSRPASLPQPATEAANKPGTPTRGTRRLISLAVAICLITLSAFTAYRTFVRPSFDYVASAAKHARGGDMESALADYDKAVASSPNDAALYRLRGDVNTKVGNYDRALADYTQSLRVTQNPEAYVGRGNLYVTLKRYDDAVADYSKAIELNPNEARAYFGRSLAYISAGLYERAVADCDESVHLNPLDDGSYNNRGLAYAHLGRMESALSDYSQAIKLNPRNAKAYGNRGHVYFDGGDYDKALSDYEQALLIEPQVNVFKSRALLYRRLGKQELADDDERQAELLQSRGAER